MSSVTISETPGLGSLLRQIRRRKRLTQDEVARAAGIGRVTLNRWECGVQRPRVPELEALLTALVVTPGERRQAMANLETPGAVARTRQQVARIAEQTGLSPLPGGGDLLRALRRRRGVSLEEAATGAGVGPATLRRWEAGDAWPDPTRLHALCWRLGAYEQEIAALTAGDFAPTAVPPQTDTQSPLLLDYQLDGLRQRVTLGDYTLMDLHCLTLESRAWTLALHGDAGRRLLSRAHQIHAMALSFQGHLQEAKRQAERAMQVWPDAYPREPIWFYCGVLISQAFSDGGTRWGGRRGREILRPLLAQVSQHADAAWGGLEVWMLSETAVCLAQESATDEALAVGEEACRVAEVKTGPAEVARRKNSLAGLLVKSQRHADALTLLGGVSGNTPYHATELALVRAEAAHGLGSAADAQDWLGEAYRLIHRYGQAHLLGRADGLARQS